MSAKPPETFSFDRLKTPIGAALLVTDAEGFLRALAAKLGMPKAMRAVGHANGSNPLSVVVPCHRLIGANGSLVKYGSGLMRKRWLLAHEGVDLKGQVR
jgi:O-6-methylguanine DNA methyltransferase